MDFDTDDEPVGVLLTRKEMFRYLGGAGLLAWAGIAAGCGGSGTNGVASLVTASPSPAASTTVAASPTPTPGATPAPNCVAQPALTEGPYFVDEKLNRSDIRTDPATGVASVGVPLVLTLYVASVSDGCAGVSNATVDIWHADAAGRYSDIASEGTAGREFLRGYQTTDANGKVVFTTTYPGWYNGRAVHLHFKVRGTTTAGRSFEFTSQFFFNETTTDAVYTQSPYNTRGARTTRNTGDGIYAAGGSQLILPAVASGDGYAATFTIGLTV